MRSPRKEAESAGYPGLSLRETVLHAETCIFIVSNAWPGWHRSLVPYTQSDRAWWIGVCEFVRSKTKSVREAGHSESEYAKRLRCSSQNGARGPYIMRPTASAWESSERRPHSDLVFGRANVGRSCSLPVGRNLLATLNSYQR